MIHEEICTYEVAKLAKEKGFDEECREFYCDDKSQKRITRISCNRHVTSFDYCSNSMLEDYYPPHEYCYIAAPTQSLLQRWLRKEKALHIQITLWEKGWYNDIWAFEYHEEEKEYSARQIHQSTDFDTYELALEDALKYALEI